MSVEGRREPPWQKPVANGRVRLRLHGEQQTLAIPLYAKALDYRSKHPILNDRMASELVNRLDFEFESIRSPAGALLVVRARQLDEWLREFLGRNPDSVVLNLGCGLDTRIARINPPSSVSWFDVDFPEVIQLRRVFFSDRDGYRMLGSSILQPEWLTQIPRHRPVVALADGVLEYLSEADVKTLLNRLTENFHHGSIMFDVLNSYAIRSATSRRAGSAVAGLKWPVDDLRNVDALDPKLRRTTVVPLLGSKFVPRRYRLLYALTYLTPNLRKSMRLIRYEF
jgi:O-methyltransferase involved in polyketide biosynthesis